MSAAGVVGALGVAVGVGALEEGAVSVLLVASVGVGLDADCEVGLAVEMGRVRRLGSPRKALGRGVGRLPLSSAIELRRRTATSVTSGDSGWSAVSVFTPPVSMTLQKGQPVAISEAPVSRACWVRNSLMRVPWRSSINMRAPPAPQQKASLRLWDISVTSTPVASRSSRGGS